MGGRVKLIASGIISIPKHPTILSEEEGRKEEICLAYFFLIPATFESSHPSFSIALFRVCILLLSLLSVPPDSVTNILFLFIGFSVLYRFYLISNNHNYYRTIGHLTYDCLSEAWLG